MSLLQQDLVGGDDEMSELAQGASSDGLQVTATDTFASAKSRTTTTAHTAMYDAFIFSYEPKL